MDYLSMEIGRAVISRQGRDVGRAFIVTQIVDDQFVMLADGDTRKLDHQKKKKRKHLHLKPVLMQDAAEKLNSKQLQDAQIRRFLRENGLVIDQPLSKED